MTKFNFLQIKQELIYLYYKIYWFWVFSLRKRLERPVEKPYTIGITTFRERYDLLFKDLLKRIVYIFPYKEIIIAVNGHYNHKLQEEYLDKIYKYCKKFPNVKLVTYKESQGLSKLWNQIILNAGNDNVFIFNDDILFKHKLANEIAACGVLNERISLLNNSFSHFMIDRNLIKDIGWFDERFAEIGGEDDDYHVRLVLNGMELKRHNITKIHSYKPKLIVNSYGRTAKDNSYGYSDINTQFLLSKWDISNEPFDGAKYIIKSQGNFWKLKPGMDTPDFYRITK